MALEYIYPRVDVDESNVGPRPSIGVSLSSIGIIGTFEKGPVNQIVTIGSADRLIEVFGQDKKDLTGVKSALSAFAQGANDFKIIRIGSSTIKESSIKLKDVDKKDSVMVSAINPGTWGDEIKVAIASGTNIGTFKLIVTYKSKLETFDNLSLDNLLINSKLIKLSKVDAAVKIPDNITSVNLSGGNSGANATDTDYIGSIDSGKRTGLKLFETIRVGIVICAQQSSTLIHNALITHCANMSVGYGLRMAVLNSPKDLEVDEVLSLTKTLDSMRAVFTYPWCQFVDIPGELIAPDGFYAGRLATLSSNKSPSNKLIDGIVSLEKDFTLADIKALTIARISPIALEPNRGFRIKNGATLSSDSAWNQTGVRRIFDEIEMEVFDNTQWAKSEDNTPSLWDSIKDQIDNMLRIKKSSGKIFDFKPTICDETINPPESVAARILKTRIRIRPTFAADFIDHSVERLVGNEK